MPRTVKIRPDQPLFKADAFRMPLWLHAPFEVVRGFYKWMTAGLNKDNPHNNPMQNATLTRAAKLPHRNAFWTGKPVHVKAKWKIIVRRWLLVFTFLAMVKYLPWVGWSWLFKRVGHMLTWVGLDVLPFAWRHLWFVPVFIALTVLAVYLTVWGVRRTAKAIKARHSGDAGTPWYDIVLLWHAKAVRFAQRRGWIR